MDMRKIKKKWKDAIVYECVCCDGSTIMVDEVIEKNGEIYFKQVYPYWKAFPTRILGHTGTPLAKRGYEELLKYIGMQRVYKEEI